MICNDDVGRLHLPRHSVPVKGAWICDQIQSLTYPAVHLDVSWSFAIGDPTKKYSALELHLYISYSSWFLFWRGGLEILDLNALLVDLCDMMRGSLIKWTIGHRFISYITWDGTTHFISTGQVSFFIFISDGRYLQSRNNHGAACSNLSRGQHMDFIYQFNKVFLWIWSYVAEVFPEPSRIEAVPPLWVLIVHHHGHWLFSRHECWYVFALIIAPTILYYLWLITI